MGFISAKLKILGLLSLGAAPMYSCLNPGCKSNAPFDFYYADFRFSAAADSGNSARDYIQLIGYQQTYPIRQYSSFDMLRLPLNLNADVSQYKIVRASRVDTVTIQYKRSYEQEKRCGLTLTVKQFSLVNSTVPTENLQFRPFDSGICELYFY